MQHFRDFEVHLLPNRFAPETNGVGPIEIPRDRWGERTNLHEVCNTRYDDKAMMQVLVPPETPYPRVGRRWLTATYKGATENQIPHIELIILDVDHARKAAGGWHERDGDESDFLDLLERLREAHGFGWYLSSSGARLIGTPPHPIPAHEYEDWMRRFLDRLEDEGFPVGAQGNGHHIDTACTRVGQLFKAPMVPESHPDKAPLPHYVPEIPYPVRFDTDQALSWTWASGASSTCSAPRPDGPSRKWLKGELEPLRGQDYWIALTDPQPIAQPGERHDTMLRVAGSVSKLMRLDDPEPIYDILHPSVMASLEGASRSQVAHTLEDLWKVCNFTANCRQQDLLDEQHLEEALAELQVDQLDLIAQTVGCAPAEASKYIVLETDDGSIIVWDSDLGGYRPTVTKRGHILTTLNSWCPDLVQIRTKKGKLRSRDSLMLQYSTKCISSVAYSYTIDAPEVDLDRRTVTFPTTEVRLEPRRHDHVHAWLQLLGGTNLLDWMAMATDLTRPLCALYLNGGQGCGKTLLAHGLSKVWDRAPVPYHSMQDRFQRPLLSCPLVFGDEGLSLRERGRSASEVLREMLGSPTRSVELKGLAPVKLDGFLRVIVAANDDKGLKIDEALNAGSSDAIEKRIGYINCGTRGARAFLEALPFERRAAMAEREIGEHALWLAANHQVTPEVASERFGAWGSNYAETAKLSIGRTSTVAQVIGTWWMRRGQTNQDDLWVGEGVMYVSVESLEAHWKAMTHERAPSSQHIYSALRHLVVDGEEGAVRVRFGGEQSRRWPIDPEKIDRVMTAGGRDFEFERASTPIEEWILERADPEARHTVTEIRDVWSEDTGGGDKTAFSQTLRSMADDGRVVRVNLSGTHHYGVALGGPDPASEAPEPEPEPEPEPAPAPEPAPDPTPKAIEADFDQNFLNEWYNELHQHEQTQDVPGVPPQGSPRGQGAEAPRDERAVEGDRSARCSGGVPVGADQDGRGPAGRPGQAEGADPCAPAPPRSAAGGTGTGPSAPALRAAGRVRDWTPQQGRDQVCRDRAVDQQAAHAGGPAVQGHRRPGDHTE